MTQRSQQIATHTFTLTEQVLGDMQQRISSYQDVQTLLDSLDEANASLVFDIIMSTVVIFNASDLHIDAIEQGARIRIRLDSILHDVATLNSHLSTAFLVSRKINERT